MPIYEWSDEYSVGIRSMDSHHKKLFDLINSLNEAMRTGQGEAVYVGIINELADYTRYHFSEEEKLMAKINYSGLESQKNAHRLFINKIEEFKQEADKGMALFIVSPMSTTTIEWLKQHILVMDKKYHDEMAQQGIS